MTHTSTAVHDVFLSHALTDAPLAVAVKRELEAAGLSVVMPADMPMGDDWSETILREIGASLSFVVLLTPTSVRNPSLPLEVGAAWGLAIPTHVLASGVSAKEIPVFLSKYLVRELWDGLPETIRAIRSQTRPINEDQRAALIGAYQQTGLTVDALIAAPAAVRQLADQFQLTTGTRLKSDRLIHELMRLRKSKRLPKLTARSAG